VWPSVSRGHTSQGTLGDTSPALSGSRPPSTGAMADGGLVGGAHKSPRVHAATPPRVVGGSVADNRVKQGTGAKAQAETAHGSGEEVEGDGNPPTQSTPPVIPAPHSSVRSNVPSSPVRLRGSSTPSSEGMPPHQEGSDPAPVVTPAQVHALRQRMGRITSQSLELVGLLEREEAKVEAAQADHADMRRQVQDLEAQLQGTVWVQLPNFGACMCMRDKARSKPMQLAVAPVP